MDLVKAGLRKVKDEVRVSPDGDVYHATKWEHSRGDTIEVNVDLEPVRYHARVNEGKAAVNMDERGLLAFIRRVFG